MSDRETKTFRCSSQPIRSWTLTSMIGRSFPCDPGGDPDFTTKDRRAGKSGEILSPDEIVEGDFFGFVWQTLVIMVVTAGLGMFFGGRYNRQLAAEIWQRTGGDPAKFEEELMQAEAEGRR